jgi:FkbH-like protein
MYETEANNQVEPADQVPSEVLDELRSFRKNVVSRTQLPWSEHCTECVWPTCYSTCDLYSPRADGRCRRFVDGMVRLECPGSVTSYLLKIKFKRWGKLWTPGNTHLLTLREADQLEQRDKTFGSVLHQLPLPAPIRKFAAEKRYGWKKRTAVNRRPAVDVPDQFVVECWNPGEQVINLSLTMRPSNDEGKIPYQRLIQVMPGFLREEIPAVEISRVLDLRAPFSVELIPNEAPDGATLFFGLVDFVKTEKHQAGTLPQVKCIVWDLDNTVWDGILVEDGAEKLTLKPGIVDVILELDRRGILQSVASKNNFDEAMAMLRSNGIGEYIVHPQISWAPKSEAVKTIAKKLNIGMDTLLMVDDSDFELAQVQSACAGVRVLHAERYRELTDMPVCRPPVTEESANRRKMYQQEAIRESMAESFGGDYLAFLADCGIEMEIEHLSAANMERVHELTQRTNQMNFSGKRYERQVLEQIAATSYLDTYVISCRDRFGRYGIVGFSIIDSREPRMTDLMFSCRIQAKRVEHAFLAYLLKRYIKPGVADFRASYCKTPRNAVSGRVFHDMGMEEEEVRDGVTSLVFHRDCRIVDDGIITVAENFPPVMAL